MANIITVTNGNDSGAGSLRQAIATAQVGDTITFDPSLANQTITLTSGQLDIDKDLIIDGSDAAGLTISGNNASRIFETTFATNFTLRNLVIANGKTTESGEAGAGAGIKTASSAILVVENSEFNNNVAGGEGGGAIFAGFQGNTTIINSKFDNNDGTPDNNERGGGAIATKSAGSLTVRNSEFTNNKGINGGAINHLLGNLTVENSRFLNNDATAQSSNTGIFGLGGAIATDGANASGPGFGPGSVGGQIIVRGSYFEGNRALHGGGANLYAYQADKVIVEDSSFVGNTAINTAAGGGNGGGLRHDNSEFTITNTTFSENAADSQGAGLWVDRNSPTTITNSTFSGNRVGDEVAKNGLGGGMTIFSQAEIINSTFADNFSGGHSAAMFVGDQQQITVANTIFDNNTIGESFPTLENTNRQLIDGGNNLQSPPVQTVSNLDNAKVTANITIADPQLGPLQEINGALVRPLVAGSPAIDAGTNTNAPATDQLGQPRSVDGDGNGSQITDIGAYEFVDNTTPANNPPTVANNQALTLNEGATSTITNAQLEVTDADGDSVTFTISALPNNGTLKLNDVALAVNDTFAQTDIDNGNLSYVHNGGETTQDTVSLSATDGNGGNIGNIDFNIEVNAVNDRPTNINLSNNKIAENSNAETVIGQLSTVDAESGDTHTYTLVDDANGRFALLGEQVVVADGSKLDFETNGSHKITVKTTDSGTPNKSFQKQFTIQVTDVTEAPQGVNLRGTNAGERLAGTPQEDTLSGADGNDTLVGLDKGDVLRGGNGRDRLNGGTGPDTMRGGAGNDFYIVDDSNDKVIENPDEGADGVLSRISYRLPVNLERLVLGTKEDLEAVGNSTDNRIAGNSGNNKLVGAVGDDTMLGKNGSDTLSGGRGNDILIGNGGNDLLKGHRGRDRLNGGLGRDTMVGGPGNDFYLVNRSDDEIVEKSNEGQDVVESSATYRLPVNLERLVLAGKDDIDGTGNSLNNHIAGNSANNKLLGAAGDDTIFGVGGRDTLGGGRGNDILLGGTDRDILRGHRGRDRLNGFAGDDNLTGGLGGDLFIFNTNEQYRAEELGTDAITDFTRSQGDKILLDKRTFTAITSDKGPGFSVGSEFETVDSDAAAAVSDAVVVYNQANGNLFYNPNGSNNGLGSGGLFATLTDAPALVERDFVIR